MDNRVPHPFPCVNCRRIVCTEQDQWCNDCWQQYLDNITTRAIARTKRAERAARLSELTVNWFLGAVALALAAWCMSLVVEDILQ